MKFYISLIHKRSLISKAFLLGMIDLRLSLLLERRILMRIQLTSAFILIAFLQISSASIFAQKITLHAKNIALEKVFAEISKQSGYDFFYSSNTIQKAHSINVQFNNADLNEVLDYCFKNQPLVYSIKNKAIVVKNKRPSQEYIVLQQSAAPIIISGKVSDEEGEPLIGVSVKVKESVTGTVTDANGQFTISIPEDKKTLVFSYVGFLSQEVIVDGRSSLSVALVEDLAKLEEVVVIGYGTAKKSDLTGSVVSVNGDVIAKTPTTNVTNALAGLLPGVVLKNTSGAPGNDNNVLLIRGKSTTGNTSPLVVVDGVPGVAGWERINTNDIESISVLKDASAAIYGARAANGVILITTKRGLIGEPIINFSFNQGISQPTRLPKMASSFEFAQYVNQLDEESGTTPRYTDEMIQKFRDGSDPNYINEDWYTTSLRKSVPMSQHNLSIRGGRENIKYSISGSYSNEKGIFKQSDQNYKTYSVRSNLDAVINKWIKVGFDLNGSLLNNNTPGGGTNFGFLKQIPFTPVFWANGLPSSGIEAGINPIINASPESGNVNDRANNYVAKGSFDINIPWIKGLGVDGYIAYSTRLATIKDWKTPVTVYDYDKTTDEYIPRTGRLLTPELTQSYSERRQTLTNLRLKYKLSVNNHNLESFIAVEQLNALSNNFSAFRKDFISDQIDELFAGSLENQMTNGTRAEDGRENLFGRFSYNFEERYFMDLTFRYDGSYAFPKGNQWGFFPSASAAWLVSRENFMKRNFGFIEHLKLRASYGQMGNDAIEPFQYLRTYTLNNSGMVFGLNPVLTQGLIANVTPNPNITWEVATISNIGMDANFLNGSIGLVFDVFKQRRSNILATRDLAVPVYTGLILPRENIGIVENKGFELELFHVKKLNEFSYRIGGNIAFSKNKIIDIDEADNVPTWQKSEGHTIDGQRMYQALGIIRTQEQLESNVIYPGSKIGDLYYRDVDDNGIIDTRDMVMSNKSNIPEITFGFNLSLNYKGFGLWANFAGATNYWQYYLVNARVAINQLQDVIVNRYTPGSMDSKYPRLPTQTNESEPSGVRSDFWMMDASYLKLKTFELSYNIPENLLLKVRAKSLRVYVNGNNLFTIDRLKWNDPENSNNANAQYPQQKVYNFGIDLTF